MKILAVTSGPAQGSGVRTAASALTGVLEGLGCHVVSLAVDASPRQSGNRINRENLVSVVRDARTIASAVKEHRPDLVWFHSLGFPLLPAMRTRVLMVAVRGRAPVVCHLHAYGLDAERIESDRLGRLALGRLVRVASMVVVLDDAAAVAVQQAVGRANVVAVPNVVELPSHTEWPSDNDRMRFVFVGGLVRRKGVPELLDAFRSLDDAFELHLIGGPGEDGADAAASLVASATDLHDRVAFHGELDDDGVREQLRSADVFVLPSHSEGMPIALLEAMSEARPVVVSQAGGMGRIVRGASCGTVIETVDSRTIAKAIRDLGSRRNELRDMGLRGRAAIAAAHAPSAVELSVRQILDRLVVPRVEDHR